MAHPLVICFLSLVVVLVAGGVFVVPWLIDRQVEPALVTLTSAKLNQSAILASGVLDRVWILDDPSEQLTLLSGARDPAALDVRRAPLVFERPQKNRDRLAVDMRSSGRDGKAGTKDDFVVLALFVRAKGQWHSEFVTLVEKGGRRTEVDISTGGAVEDPR